ncbi:membrane protein insertase YidC [Zhongshania sp. BJYM1]|uniref:membrane protein insertase YidC n=1 Tax=Zhongshania aquatica TaxID=2965069 RepID=UPI0022B59EEF|nr:membrane protein insertase YidC [Marortus sp. BJYM1]
MIDFQRYLLIAAIAALSLMLLVEWQKFETSNPVVSVVNQNATSAAPKTSSENGDLPAIISSEDINTIKTDTTNVKYINVQSDVLDLKIDLHGGDIVYAALPKYTASLKAEDPFVILEDNETRHYIAQSGLIGANATDTSKGRPHFSASNAEYRLEDGSDTLNIDLSYQYSDTITIIKRFHLSRGKYLINVEYIIDNRSDKPFQASFFGQLKRGNSTDPSVNGEGGMFAMKPFMGVAYATDEDLYKKTTFSKMQDKPIKANVNGGWIGVVQHYFVSAWIPSPESVNELSTIVTKQGMNIARVTSASVTVAPQSQGKISSGFYTGPKDQYSLKEVSPGLELTVDYGWLWWIAQPLFWLLTKIHSVLGNWGFSIIGVTILVKAAFFQLNKKAFTSMANMRKFQPKLAEIKERYADDRQKQSQAMMELYKKEKINPLGGCLPMVVQMPVFISLYWVLMESIELRHAPFILWIHDLSAMDPYFVLPLVMGLSMFIQQRLNPAPPDPMQAKIMQWMPIVFTFFFLFFPAGLVLYWVVNNTLSIIQQYIITKRLEKNDLATR